MQQKSDTSDEKQTPEGHQFKEYSNQSTNHYISSSERKGFSQNMPRTDQKNLETATQKTHSGFNQLH